MSKRFILNKFGQKHSFDDLVSLFQELDENERLDIIQTLGLDGIVNPGGGGVAPQYSADIESSEERFLNPSVAHNITLTGKLYNYFADASDKVVEYKWTRNSDSPASDVTWEKFGKTITITDADLTDKVKLGKVIFTLTIKVDGVDEVFKDEIDFSTIVTLNAVQIQASHSLFLGGDPAQITLTAITTGLSVNSYKWYVNNQLRASTRIYQLPSSIVSNGQVANIRLEVIDVKNNNYTDFISIPKISNGTKGEPGVPGPAGEDGESRYTWIKYADDNQGGDISEYPTKQNGDFREWMGIATNKLSPIESNDYRDYTWSKYIGEDGIPGTDGEDGVSSYIWVVYSQFPEGINTAGRVEIHNDPYDEVAEEYMVYLGLAYNKETKTEPNFNAMTEAQFKAQGFLWSKIKGEDGHTGYTFDLTNELHSIPTDSEGKTHSSVAYSGAASEAYLYYGNDVVPLSDYNITKEVTTGLVYTESNVGTTGKKFTVTSVNDMGDAGSIVIKAYDKQNPPNLLATASFSLVKTKNSPGYKIEPNIGSIRVQPGVGTAADVITPTTISVKVLKNNGYEVAETTQGTLSYRYSYQTGDGTPIAIGSTLTLSNSGNPSYIQFLYFDPVTNMLADIESVPFVRDGKQGDPGAPGTPGQNGAPGAPGIPGSRGPMPRMLNWQEGYTYYRSADTRDYIYFRSTNTTLEGWYCVREVAANLYNTTPTGIQEYRAVANSGSPDTAIFQKQDFTSSAMFGTIIAENANLAGFIFRNQKLYSQLGLDTENSEPQFSNLMLNGSQGYMQFAKNFLLQKEGIYQKDVTATSENKNRLALEFVQGTPRLRMWHPNGVLGIEMGIIEGVLTLNFYDSAGNLVYKLGQTGIVYVDRVPATYTAGDYVEFTSASYGDDAALRTEFLSRAIATRTATINDGPDNKYLIYDCASVTNKTLLSYNAGKNETSENNKQYESLLFLQSGTTADDPATKAKFTGVLTSTKIGDTVFHGTWSDGVNSESNRSGYLYYNPISQTAESIKIKVSRYVNGAVVESKTIDIGTVRVTDLPS